jgi:hypothetical protein
MRFDCTKWLEIVKDGGPSKALKFPDGAANWVESRKEEVARIDPNSAELYWDYGRVSDPYNLYPDTPCWALDIDDRDYECCDPRCHDPLCSYSAMLLARNPDSEIVVHLGELNHLFRNIILRHYRNSDIPFIRHIDARIRPTRYYRRCPVITGVHTVNQDGPRRFIRPAKGKVWRKRAKAVAAEIDPKTADVCRQLVSVEFFEGHEASADELRELLFYRDPSSRIWVPETYITQELNDKIKKRIKRKRIDVLWMDQCDD